MKSISIQLNEFLWLDTGKKKTKWYSVWHIVNSGVGGGQRCEGGQVFSRGHHERGVQRQQANTLAFEASLIKYE